MAADAVGFALRSRNVRREEPLDVQMPDPIIDHSLEAARQLASRAPRRVQRENTVPDPDLAT